MNSGDSMTDTPLRDLSRKRYAYLIAFLPLCLPWTGLYLGRLTGHYEWWSFYTFITVFAVIPLLDYALGQDKLNPRQQDTAALSDDGFYRALTLACLPIQLINLSLAIYVLPEMPSLLAAFGWCLSIGTVSSALGINVGHELIHKNSRLEQWCGGALLATTWYAGFKVEHLRGHHVHVSTPTDASSARYGESFYHFLPRAVFRNVRNAFRLEQARLHGNNQAFWSRQNELLWWYALSLMLTVLAFFISGWQGAVFFVGQGVFAFVLLETVNYIEHYGLHRRQLSDGRYERVTHLHSWNSSYRLSNLLLFHLQRHSDHHAFPKRRYQVLRHFDDSPQLPGGYMAMIVLAWIPAAWFRLINPRVRAYYQDSAPV